MSLSKFLKGSRKGEANPHVRNSFCSESEVLDSVGPYNWFGHENGPLFGHELLPSFIFKTSSFALPCSSFHWLQELEKSKQDVERQQAELQNIKESFSKAQLTIRAARSRIHTITSDKEQVCM